MALERFVRVDGTPLRRGYTTGSCAAAAARAAVRLLLTGEETAVVRFMAPCGEMLSLPVETSARRTGWASCGVRKDAGDDPDITHGLLIIADAVPEGPGPGVTLRAGEGVGTVTLPGLDQPPGEPAINRVPRQMILDGAAEEAARAGFAGPLTVTVRVPEGAEAAKRTFNPRLGIVGGISILGTTGMVEPMSEAAYTAAIRAELSVLAAAGERAVILTPGNYGRDFLRGMDRVPDRLAVKCANFLGDAIDAALELGFRSVLVVGHLGKLVKLAGGMLNTHSRYGDCRMELMAAHAALCGAGQPVVRALMEAPTTVRGGEVLREAGLLEPVMASLAGRMDAVLRRRAGAASVGAIAYLPGEGAVLATPGAWELLERMKEKGEAEG